MSTIVKDQKTDIQVKLDTFVTTVEKMAFLDGCLFAISQRKKSEKEIAKLIKEGEKA